jgi:trehalose 6-phosphate phosphatase
MTLCTPNWIDERLVQAKRLWLFLDYDGTLANFAPTPDDVRPDPELIALLTHLASLPQIQVGVISGRRLSHVKALVPVPGALLAGTYGIELQMPDGNHLDRVEYSTIRPPLDVIKPLWWELIKGHQGFFLEDKGWSLALHARFAADKEAERVLAAANRALPEGISSGLFRVLGGHRFLEVAPRMAHKGRTIEYILDHRPWQEALPLYLGDDDKDEEAFTVIKNRGGIAILVAPQPRETGADCRLDTPEAARNWLEALPALFAGGGSNA